MTRRLLILFAFILAGWAFGLLDSRIPMPASSTIFWAGNLGSPWIVLPFLAGWAQGSRGWAERSRGWALAAGALACAAAMVGFFGPGGGWGPASFVFVTSWLAVGALAGGLYGLFGDTWGRSRTLLDGLALALPFILEPLVWSVGFGYARGATAYWYGEAAVGVALLVLVVVANRRRAATAQASEP